MQIWRERLKIFVFSPKMWTPQSIDFFVTDAKCARRQKTFSFISKPYIYLNQEWAMKKNYDNKNILKYINMKWKPTLSFYTTNLSKLGQWDKPGSHWRHVYEWMWTGIYHTKVRICGAHYHSCDFPQVKKQKCFFWNKHNFAADPLNKNICKKKCTAIMCPTCLYKLQPAPETWWCPDRCFLFFFFKSKWKTTSKDRCPARVKTLQEQISRPIDADTHCFRYASLLKSSFNSNRFYLYKTANSSGMTNKNTTEEMQIWRERLKIFRLLTQDVDTTVNWFLRYRRKMRTQAENLLFYI